MKILREQDEPQEEDIIFFDALRQFARGNITYAQLKEANQSDLIVDVDLAQPLGSSVLHIRFDDDENLLNALNVDENDIWFLNSIFSSYSDYAFTEYDSVKDDFDQGYIVFYELDDDSKNDLEKIAELIINKEFNLDNENYRVELAKKLFDTFPDEIDRILDDYRMYKEYEMEQTARESITKEIKNALEDKGFKLERKFYKISTKITNLLHLYMLVDDKMLNLKELIIELFKDENIGAWEENRYEFQDYNNFDSVRFNIDVRNQLEKMKDKLDESVDIKKYLEIYDNITSKFELEKWYELPHAPEYRFRINSIDLDKLLISVSLKNKKNQVKKLPGLTEEGFLKFVYNPQLFGLNDLFFT